MHQWLRRTVPFKLQVHRGAGLRDPFERLQRRQQHGPLASRVT